MGSLQLHRLYRIATRLICLEADYVDYMRRHAKQGARLSMYDCIHRRWTSHRILCNYTTHWLDSLTQQI